jgi:hypothetical protein
MTYVKQVWVDESAPGAGDGTRFTKARMDTIEQGIADAHGGLASPPLVTALPGGTPVEGQEVLYLASDTNGIVWHLRYRGLKADGVTANPSPYKWEYIGGSELWAYTAAAFVQAAANSGIPAADPADGPTLTLPLAGEYVCDWSYKNNGSPAGSMLAYLMWNGAAVNNLAGGNYIDWWTTPAGDFSNFLTGRTLIACNQAAKVLSVRYASGVANAQFAERKLLARPVRVG